MTDDWKNSTWFKEWEENLKKSAMTWRPTGYWAVTIVDGEVVWNWVEIRRTGG